MKEVLMNNEIFLFSFKYLKLLKLRNSKNFNTYSKLYIQCIFKFKIEKNRSLCIEYIRFLFFFSMQIHAMSYFKFKFLSFLSFVSKAIQILAGKSTYPAMIF